MKNCGPLHFRHFDKLRLKQAILGATRHWQVAKTDLDLGFIVRL